MTALNPPSVGSLVVSVRPNRSEVVVAVAGDLDLVSADQLDGEVRELLGAGWQHVVLDLHALGFIDSTGLRTLIAMRNAAKRSGHRLELVPGPPEVDRVFALTGTRGLFDWREAPPRRRIVV